MRSDHDTAHDRGGAPPAKHDPTRFPGNDADYPGEFRCLGCGGPDDGHYPLCLDAPHEAATIMPAPGAHH